MPYTKTKNKGMGQGYKPFDESVGTRVRGKPCNKCGGTQFYVSANRCVPCHRAMWRKNRAELSDAERLWRQARNRSRRFDRDFNIEISDIVVPEICPVLKIEMVKPSLDRVDNEKGYIKGNVRVISHRANSLKRDASLEELRSLVKYVEDHLNGVP